MKVLKGFASHTLFANNAVGITNPIGELSTYARTFSRDIGIYVNAADKHVVLNAFLSRKDEVDVDLDVTTRDQALSIVQWIYNNTLTHSGQQYADQILFKLLDAFESFAMDFECGEMVTDGTYWVPEWLSWRFKGDEENYNKIWFSDSSFCHKYDEFAIVVVPPIDNLDDFFRRSQEVEQLVNARDNSEMMLKIQEAKGGHPETIVSTAIYEYRDPLSTTKRIKTNWSLLIYGEAGNNIDSIKDALVNHILSNSKYGRDRWVEIFPEIFRRTEFILIPFFDQYAIPNKKTEAGIYSPITQVKDSFDTIMALAPEYPQSHIISHWSVMAHPYKSLNLGVTSSDENRDELYQLKQVYPDYIAVSTTSQDFNRMSEATREFAQVLYQLLLLAETINRYSDIPKGYTKVTRGNLLYVVKNINNIHYLVPAKSTWPLSEPQ